MKILFICLLIANVLLFIVWQSFSGGSDSHQPQRLAQQENSQYLKLISSRQAESSTSAQNAGPVLSCLEWGPFQTNELTKVESLVALIGFGTRRSRQPVPDSVSTIVYIPPLANKAAADKKADELKNLGVNDFFIIQDNSNNLRWGISLGVFKSEEAAKQLLARLANQGVRSAILGKRTEVSNSYNLVFTDVSSSEKTSLDKLKAEYPAQDLHACKP